MTDSTYSLPDLAYDTGALEPHLDGRIVELHHGKRQAAHVKGAKTALEQRSAVRDQGDFSTISTAACFEAFWNPVDWTDAARRLTDARREAK